MATYGSAFKIAGAVTTGTNTWTCPANSYGIVNVGGTASNSNLTVQVGSSTMFQGVGIGTAYYVGPGQTITVTASLGTPLISGVYFTNS